MAAILEADARVIASTGTGVVVGLSWRQPDRPQPSELFQVLRFQGGKIVDMGDYPDRASALRAVGARP